ncbi:hypothetical protein B0E41_11110 [Hydrogenophaga sp. A37]|nr:hypothetical protein B0E41_11110 [Hydrogenophaga sp. A37]
MAARRQTRCPLAGSDHLVRSLESRIVQPEVLRTDTVDVLGTDVITEHRRARQHRAAIEQQAVGLQAPFEHVRSPQRRYTGAVDPIQTPVATYPVW